MAGINPDQFREDVQSGGNGESSSKTTTFMRNISLYTASGTTSGTNSALVTYLVTQKVKVFGITISSVMAAAAAQHQNIELSQQAASQSGTNDTSGILAHQVNSNLGLAASTFSPLNTNHAGGFILNPGDRIYIHATNSGTLTTSIIRVNLLVE